MILKKAYGPTTVASGAALLMALSIVFNESLVARAFGTCTLQAFGGNPNSVLIPVLGVGLIIFGYLVNVSGNRSVGFLSIAMAALKAGGIALFGTAIPNRMLACGRPGSVRCRTPVGAAKQAGHRGPNNDLPLNAAPSPYVDI